MGDGFANETHRLSKRYGDQIVASTISTRGCAGARSTPSSGRTSRASRPGFGCCSSVPPPGTASVLGARPGSAIKAVDVRGKVVLAVG
jgi:hypothetical protein